MVRWATAEQLQKELGDLDHRVQTQADEDLCFRKLNAGFSVQNETTQMLMDVCEKLAMLKESIQRANFEEHTADLPCLCKHFGTSLDAGLPDRIYRERHSARHAVGCGRRDSRRGRRMFALCCQTEFPPHQSWWTELQNKLVPSVEVLRGGKLLASPAKDLVPGDIYYLRAGQRVVVDGRILVHSVDTAVDMTQLTAADDVRVCSSEPTGDTMMSSRNMVFKDGYLISGSLFCLAVRTAGDSLLPCSDRDMDDDEFTVDVNLPSGLTMSQCKTTFKALCVQAHLACRSFRTMVQLGRVGVLVVLLTQELLGSAAALCAVARRLGRALVLVGCGLSLASLEALAQQASLELLDLNAPSTSSRTGTPRSESLARSQALGEGEAAQLSSLAQRLAGQRAGGAVLARLSQRGLVALCGHLADARDPPLYAVGQLDFPDAFRSLVLAPRGPASRLKSTVTPPRGSVVLGADLASEPQSIVPLEKCAAQASTPETPAAGQEDGHKPEGKMIARFYSVSSQGTASAGTLACTLSHDPAAALTLPRNAGVKSSIEMLVALNSVGVVSEHADCVLLKPDLACLGQALEIAAKVVPLASTAS